MGLSHLLLISILLFHYFHLVSQLLVLLQASIELSSYFQDVLLKRLSLNHQLCHFLFLLFDELTHFDLDLLTFVRSWSIYFVRLSNWVELGSVGVISLNLILIDFLIPALFNKFLSLLDCQLNVKHIALKLLLLRYNLISNF